MRSPLKDVKFLIQMLKETALLLFYIIKVKDPCENCVVSACCSEECEDRIILDIHLRVDTLKGMKSIAWFTLIYFPSVLIWLTYLSIKG